MSREVDNLNNLEQSPDDCVPILRRRILQTAAGVGVVGLGTGIGSAGHETTECDVTLDFNREKVARVLDVQAEELTSITVFYFDRDGTAHKQEGIAPTTDEDYGPLRVRYDATDDETVIQISGRDASVRRVVAYGPECRSALTNPLDEAAGENEPPTAGFTWSPDPAVVGEEVTFSSEATDQDGEIIHYGWDFDDDGTEDAEGATVTNAFSESGEYPITHTVIDDFGASNSMTQSISIESLDLLDFTNVSCYFNEEMAPIELLWYEFAESQDRDYQINLWWIDPATETLVTVEEDWYFDTIGVGGINHYHLPGETQDNGFEQEILVVDYEFVFRDTGERFGYLEAPSDCYEAANAYRTWDDILTGTDSSCSSTDTELTQTVEYSFLDELNRDYSINIHWMDTASRTYDEVVRVDEDWLVQSIDGGSHTHELDLVAAQEHVGFERKFPVADFEFVYTDTREQFGYIGASLGCYAEANRFSG